MRQLVFENGASGPPKAFVLYGFHVGMLVWLEDFPVNRAPVLGGDRFFNAISSASISDRFSDRSRLRSKKVSKKVSKRNRNWKTSSLVVRDWGDVARVNIYIYIYICIYTRVRLSL